MEICAATKDGIVIYDALSLSPANSSDDYATGLTTNGEKVRVIATLPSPSNAVGHAWSVDGTLLASVCDEGCRVYDATQGYKMAHELPRIAPDVGGRTGGVRNMQFSPKNNFMVSYEKWDPQYPMNVHVWDLRAGNKNQRLHSTTLKGYTSGVLPVEIVKWTANEEFALELVPGEGLVVRPADFARDEDDDSDEPQPQELHRIKEKNASTFVLSPEVQDGIYYVACYIPEQLTGLVARLSMYNLSEPAKPTVELHLPAKVKDLKILFNHTGEEVLALAQSDVDESGSSYFGTSYLYWTPSNGKSKPLQVCGAKEGLVQDLCWSPTKNEFATIVGMMPATVALYDGKNGKLLTTLGVSRRNTLKWNPFGRFLAVAGFGTLPGDLDFFDRSCEETISSVRAALTVVSEWTPEGRHMISATIAPRMNEGNQLSLYRYTGEMVWKIDFKPNVVAARHEDTGGGARTKTQALLFWASVRPMKGEDQPASPRGGPKRKKGLPDENASAAPAAAAYRPKGAGGYSAAGGGGSTNLVQAMMRGEIGTPSDGKSIGDRWANEDAPKQLEEWEIRKLEREAKKDREKKEQEAKDAEKEALRNVEKDQKNSKKKLKELKAQLEELEKLKDKDWDELTEEDEEQLEGEADIRMQIAALETGGD